jgi:hypothetical protein
VQTSRLTRITAAALTAAALAAPTATARPVSEPGGNRPAPKAPTFVTVDQGFDIGSAALGAGGAAGLLLLTAAGASVVTRSRRAVRTVL